MIEVIVLNHLSSQLEVPVYMELPEELPDRFVIIEKVGMRREDLVTNASLAFQSYSLSSLYEAAALDVEVRQAVESLITLPEIGSARIASSYNHTDTRTKRYRYQSTYEIYYVEV